MSKLDSSAKMPVGMFSFFRVGLFGALYVISKQHVSSKASSFIELLIKLAQLLSFVLAKDAGFAWNSVSMSGLKIAVGLTTVNGYAEWFEGSVFLGLFYFSLLWVSLFVMLFAWATWSFARGSFAALWPLKLLRAIGSTSATLLYIPMLTLLLAGFRCENEDVLYLGSTPSTSWWKLTGYSCGSVGWTVQIVITALFLIVFVVLCSVWAACIQDRNILSTNLSAKAHGRMDFFFVCAKTLLVCMIKGWPQQIPVYAHIGVLIAVSCVWLGFAVFMQPFLHHVMNKAQAAAACVLLSACICLSVSQSYPQLDAAIAWYMALPFAALAGAGLVDARAQYLATCPPEALSSATDVELRARFMLHEALYGHATTVLPIPQRVIVARAAATSADGTTAVKGQAGEHVESAQIDIAEDLQALSQEDDVDTRAGIVRRIMTAAGTAAGAGYGVDPTRTIAKVITDGLARFRYSPLLNVFASSFHTYISGNRHLQLNQLLQAERKGPGLDVQYFIFATRRMMEEKVASGGGKHGISALTRVAFEKYSSDARKAVSACLVAQNQFWAEIASPRPGLDQLHILADRIAQSIQQANSAFAELAKINAHSLGIIRLQAEFSLYALNDGERAALLIAEAERLEEVQNKEMRAAAGKRLMPMEHSTVEVQTETSGLVVVSAEPGNLGMILSASPAVCRMFGYPKWQLERRSVEVLVPAPIAEWHPSMLRRFVTTATGRAMDATRMVLGQHKSGFVFPLLMTLRESSGTDGPASMLALLQPMTTEDDYLLMDANMSIAAASQRSMLSFGLSSASLTARDTSLRALLPDLDHHMEALTSKAGEEVTFVPCQNTEGGPSSKDAAEEGIEMRSQSQSRRRSVVAIPPVGSKLTSRRSARSGLPSDAAAGVHARAWLQLHTTLTGHTYYTLAWLPAQGKQLGLTAAHHAASGLSGSAANSQQGAGSVDAPAVHHGKTSQVLMAGERMGCPFLKSTGAAGEMLRSPSSSSISSGPDAQGTDEDEQEVSPMRPQNTAAGRSFSKNILGTPSVPRNSVGGSPLRTVTVQRVQPPPLALNGNNTPAAATPIGTGREATDRTPIPGRQEAPSSRSARGSTGAGLASRLGTLRANFQAALSPTGTGTARSRGHSRSAWTPTGDSGASADSAQVADRSQSREEQRAVEPAAVQVSVVSGGGDRAPTRGGLALRGVEEDKRERGMVEREQGRTFAALRESSRSPRRRSMARFAEPEEQAEVRSESGRGGSEGEEDDEHDEEERGHRRHGHRHGSKGDGGGGGDRGSYASSRASTHNKRIMSKLRKVVDESGSQPFIPQLRLLRLVALSVSAVAAAVAVGLNVYATENVNAIQAGAKAAFLAGDLCVAVLIGTQTVVSIAYSNLGLMQTHPLTNNSGFNDIQRQLARITMDKAITDAQSLFVAAQTVAPEFASLFNEPSLTFMMVSADGITGATSLTPVRMSIQEGLHQFLMSSKRLANQEIVNIRTVNPDFVMIANNGVPSQDFYEQVNATASAAVTYLTRRVQSLNDLMRVIFTATLSVLGAACLTIMLPAVLSLDAARDKLLMSMVVLPPIILNTMRAQSEQHLAAFQAEDDAEDDDRNSQGSAGESIEIGDETPNKSRDEDAGALLPMENEGEYDWSAVTNHARNLVRQQQQQALLQNMSAGNAAAGPAADSKQAASSTCCSRLSIAACCSRGKASEGRSLSKDKGTAGGSFRDLLRDAVGGGKKKASRMKLSPAWTSQSAGRVLSKSPVLVIKLLLLFNSPLVFLFILLGVSMTQTEFNLNLGIRSTHLAIASQYRQAYVSAAYITMRRALRRFGTSSLVSGDVVQVRGLVSGMAYWSHQMMRMAPMSLDAATQLPPDDTAGRSRGLLRADQLPGATGSERDLIVGLSEGTNLCQTLFDRGYQELSTGGVFASPQQCEQWPLGTRAVSGGLSRVEDDWGRATLNLLDRRAQSNSTNATSGVYRMATGGTGPYSPAAEFASDTMTYVFVSQTGVLAPSYELQTRALQAATSHLFSSFAGFQTALLSSCLVLYAVLLVVVYVLLVPRFNGMILKQRGMLLLLPVQVFDHPSAAGLSDVLNHALASSGLSVSLKVTRLDGHA